jgi:hypothetical protein
MRLFNGAAMDGIVSTPPSSADSESKILIEEYKSLRSELIELAKIRQQLLAAMIAGVGVTLNFTIGHASEFFAYSVSGCFAALIYVYGGAVLYSSNLRNMWRIASYLQIILEPRLSSVNWEISLHQFQQVRLEDSNASRQRSAHSPSQNSSIYKETMIFAVLYGASACAAILTLGVRLHVHDNQLHKIKGIEYLSVMIVVLAALALGWSTFQLTSGVARGGSVYLECVAKWKKVLRDGSLDKTPAA